MYHVEFHFAVYSTLVDLCSAKQVPVSSVPRPPQCAVQYRVASAKQYVTVLQEIALHSLQYIGLPVDRLGNNLPGWHIKPTH